MKAKIDEIFLSLQGEGIYLGREQVFVRFAGCNMYCSYCDTNQGKGVREMEADELLLEVDRLRRAGGCSVSITGGEPLLQADFLEEFLPLLKKKRLEVYLESNSSLPRNLARVIEFVDVIAADIKLPSTGGQRAYWKEHREFLGIGRRKDIFVKAVVGRKTDRSDIERAVELLKEMDRTIPFVLQPVTIADGELDKGNVMRFGEYASRFLADVRIVPQVHRLIGIR